MVPAKPLGFVPGSIVEEEDAAFGLVGGDGFSKVIEVAPEDIGLDAVEDHGEAPTGDWADGADDIGPDPTPGWARIGFHSTFIAIPEFDGGVFFEQVKLGQESGPLSLVLTLRPALGHAQVVIQLVQIADGGAITQLQSQLFLELAVNFTPVQCSWAALAGSSSTHEQIAQPLQLGLAQTSRVRFGRQSVNAPFVEHQDPHPHHPLAAAEEPPSCARLKPFNNAQMAAKRR